MHHNLDKEYLEKYVINIITQAYVIVNLVVSSLRLFTSKLTGRLLTVNIHIELHSSFYLSYFVLFMIALKITITLYCLKSWPSHLVYMARNTESINTNKI